MERLLRALFMPVVTVEELSEWGEEESEISLQNDVVSGVGME
jgi:hypothetical protein